MLMASQGDEVLSHCVPSNFHEHGFETVAPSPACKDRKLRVVYFAIKLAYKRQINARNELNGRRRVRVVLSTFNLQIVNPILMHSLQG